MPLSRWGLLGVLVVAGAAAWLFMRYRVTWEVAQTRVWEVDQSAPLAREGSRMLMLGRREDARKLWERAVQENPTSAPAHYNLGVFYQSLGQPALAAQHFREALRLVPTYERASRELRSIEVVR